MSNSSNLNDQPTTKNEGFYLGVDPYFVTNLSFTRPEAFVGILLAAAAPKGKISDDEIIDLYQFLKRTKTLLGFPPSKVNDMLKKMRTHMEEEGFESLVDRALHFYGQKSRKKIYKDACKVLFLVKKASEEEGSILDELQVCMGLSWLKTMRIRRKVKSQAAV